MKKIILLSLLAVAVHASADQVCKDSIRATTPDGRFTVNGTEVTDNTTGLVWQRCSLGQTGADCTGGSANTYTWQQALQGADQEATTTGMPWRLPNIKELGSIVEHKCFNSSINTTVFPNTPSSAYYWSASSSVATYAAWYVKFGNGDSFFSNKIFKFYVRLVRGGQ